MGDGAARQGCLERRLERACACAVGQSCGRRCTHRRQSGRGHAGRADRDACMVVATQAGHRDAGPGGDATAVADFQHGPIALKIGEVGARAGVADQGGVTCEVAADPDGLRTGAREGVVIEVAVELEIDAGAVVVLEVAVGHRCYAGHRADAWAVVADEGGTVDAHVAGAVGEGEAGAAVVLEATAEPAHGACHAAASAVLEQSATQAIVGHPRVRDQALEYAALRIDAVPSDVIDRHVVDVPVVEAAIIAIGDELDAVALQAIALDGEIRQLEIAEIDPWTDDELDDRLTGRNLRDERGAAAVDADALDVAGDIDDDRLADRVGAA